MGGWRGDGEWISVLKTTENGSLSLSYFCLNYTEVGDCKGITYSSF